MNFFQRRRLRKLVKHVLHDARHARHMRADLAEPGKLRELREAEAHLSDVFAASDEPAAVHEAAEVVSRRAREVYPIRSFPRIRENVEIVVVALAVAMGFRTYFVQPFKIPTGSMQPTLAGITVDEESGRGWTDVFPMSVARFLVFGERYTQVRATSSGRVEPRVLADEEYRYYFIGGVRHRIRKGLTPRFKVGDFVAKGQVLAEGRIKLGDHIFVNKVRYNFARPRRGDIFVFSTDDIDYQQIRKNTFYIKRLVGMPNETISIRDRVLHADGEPITEPFPFKRILEDPAYSGGYSFARVNPYGTVLSRPGDQVTLGPREYLPMGDNTDHSLDGRYFGPVPERNIVGPAFAVYWPLSKRWGRAR